MPLAEADGELWDGIGTLGTSPRFHGVHTAGIGRPRVRGMENSRRPKVLKGRAMMDR